MKKKSRFHSFRTVVQVHSWKTINRLLLKIVKAIIFDNSEYY